MGKFYYLISATYRGICGIECDNYYVHSLKSARLKLRDIRNKFRYSFIKGVSVLYEITQFLESDYSKVRVISSEVVKYEN